MKPVLQLQKQIQAEVGKEKSDYVSALNDEALVKEVADKVRAEIRQIVTEHTDREARSTAIKAVNERVMAEYEARNTEIDDPGQHVSLKDVAEGLDKAVKEEVRRRIVEDGVRPDGRDSTTIRALSAEVSVLPRVHGTGLFKRGQTQVLTVATLGTPRDSQELDDLGSEDSKRYLHHYNFPPYSTGEVRPMRSTSRRETGHGALAETALRYMIPPEDEFPYTIRLVSEVMSSNGSTFNGECLWLHPGVDGRRCADQTPGGGYCDGPHQRRG